MTNKISFLSRLSSNYLFTFNLKQGGHWSLKSLNVFECSWILFVIELFLENVGFSHLVLECSWIFAIQWIPSNCMWMPYVSTGYQCLLKLFEKNFFPWKPIFCSWNVLELFLNFFKILSGHPVKTWCVFLWFFRNSTVYSDSISY